MKCPYCQNEMQEGVITGDGRSKVYWEPQNEKLNVMDKIAGKGMIEAQYSLAKFKVKAQYCIRCEKMIFDTKISK